jgi:hypothetical protein|nr:MAG TPA: hypothetical protein [Caudoviricetes sp.]
MLKYDLSMKVSAFEEAAKFATSISVQTMGLSPAVTLGNAIQELIEKQHTIHCLKFSAQGPLAPEEGEEPESTEHEEDK